MMIVCFGDSISTGQYLDPPDVPWPVLLTVAEKVWVAAVNGDTTRLALERFPRDVQAHEPEVVVIQFGHNDANRWESDRGLNRVSSRAFEANLHEMIDRCQAFHAVPYLCTLTPSRKTDQHRLDCRHYDSVIRRVVARRHTPLIDVYDVFTRRDLGHDPEHLLLPDGLHLSGEGHRVYARTVSQVLA